MLCSHWVNPTGIQSLTDFKHYMSSVVPIQASRLFHFMKIFSTSQHTRLLKLTYVGLLSGGSNDLGNVTVILGLVRAGDLVS